MVFLTKENQSVFAPPLACCLQQVGSKYARGQGFSRSAPPFPCDIQQGATTNYPLSGNWIFDFRIQGAD